MFYKYTTLLVDTETHVRIFDKKIYCEARSWVTNLVVAYSVEDSEK
jgi:hypothetical protein